MPAVLKITGFRFLFYSDEGNEPPHIHVESGDEECKFWLDPVVLARNKGIPAHQLRAIEKLVFDNKNFLKEKNHKYHGY